MLETPSAPGLNEIWTYYMVQHSFWKTTNKYGRVAVETRGLFARIWLSWGKLAAGPDLFFLLDTEQLCTQQYLLVMAACDRAISFQNTLTRGYPVMTAAVYPLKGALPLHNTGFKKGHLTAAEHLKVEIHQLSKNHILHLSRYYFMWNYNMKISWNEERNGCTCTQLLVLFFRLTA